MYNQWRERRKALAKYVTIEKEWIGGSFVSAKVDPDDMDVATFFVAREYDALAVMVKAHVDRLLDGREHFRPQDTFDSWPIGIREEGEPEYGLYELWTGKMDIRWGRRKYESTPRGYLEVRGEP
jgi:hypothetical protein